MLAFSSVNLSGREVLLGQELLLFKAGAHRESGRKYRHLQEGLRTENAIVRWRNDIDRRGLGGRLMSKVVGGFRR